MNKKVTGIVAYITIIGWLVAFLAGDKEGAKLHLNQALVIALLGIIGCVVGFIPLVGGILGTIIGVVDLVLAIWGIVYAVQGQDKEIPIVGSIKLLG
ncbi:MAG: DUF4870 domain-containing protein [Lachnospiraceae bacterium]|nr:DUF4870 domain-containing protein [Lachnospiraceae bacterium]